jgi:hypothetical protein
MKMDGQDQYITIKQALALLSSKLSPEAMPSIALLYRLAKNKRIPSLKIGRKVLVLASAVTALITPQMIDAAEHTTDSDTSTTNKKAPGKQGSTRHRFRHFSMPI